MIVWYKDLSPDFLIGGVLLEILCIQLDPMYPTNSVTIVIGHS